MKKKKMQENTNPFKFSTYSTIAILSLTLIVILSIYTYNKKLSVIKKTNGKEENLIVIDKVKMSDQQKLLRIARETIQNKDIPEDLRESSRLFYARNASDLTPVGLSEDRKNNFIESYVTLYDIYKNSKSERNRAKAANSFLYLYTQSCSLDDWLIAAITISDINLLDKSSAESGNKKIIAHTIISSILNDANSKYSDKALVISTIETNMRLLELKKTSKDDINKFLLNSVSVISNLSNSTSSIDTSTFGVINTDRRLLTVLMTAEIRGINPKTDLEKEYRKQLDNTKQGEPADGAYVNEYDLRYLYASYLWNKGGKSNIAKIKKELDITFTGENVKNAPGWIYGLSVAEKNPFFSFLKPMSKEYPELASFLKKHGWKNV